ncbi:NADP-dependent oxidoreductase [Lentzea flaviverrucosa]|uniref:NADPH:quinone reductase n=1 Tax=Lentzea flaviverrucosa TaxID=200379 RepID=A0A1H9V248_9PSEU|nr:NADP-dependent oxidoreductase [Lentzea flaviverrucosa]RDI27589.1 NADPH:quinone reductase-like Zn-dependent oxidoreductase [Lentzea flaviverrucosa]SES15668.1 NADPH:quinone reductase [Lentzea flaviverrucosa]
MRVITQKTVGDASVLEVAEVATPVAGPGEVLVKVGAAGVNPVDTYIRGGGFPALGEPPFTLGWDVAGTVEHAAEGFAAGDEVYGMLDFPGTGGGYAEYAVVKASNLVKRPAWLTVEQAGAAPLVALTAWQTLVGRGGVSAGQRVLIHAAAGGVGHVAVQIAKALGAYVIGTASAAKHDFVRSLGADEVVDYRHQDFTGIEPVDVVLDTIGGEYAGRSAKVVKPGGVLVSTVPGNPGFDVDRASGLGIRFELFLSVTASGAELAALPQLRVQIDHAVPLADATKAHELVESGRTTGKVVLVP